MRPNIVKEKSFSFALAIIETYKFVCKEHHEFVLSKQMLRSGTAIGALIREAEHAESKKDFIHKLSIAQKEANETEYWLELKYRSNYLSIQQFEQLNNQLIELLKLLTSIIKSSKLSIDN